MTSSGLDSTFSRINAIQNRIQELGSLTETMTSRLQGKELGVGFEAMLGQAIKEEKAKPARKFAQSGKAPRDVLPPPDANGYQPLIEAAAERHGVDPRLVDAVARAESNYDQSAISPAGAIGIMQLMPDTAKALGVNPYDAAANIDGGAHYLRQQLNHFGGDVAKAVAAYNAGPGAVENYDGIPPYSETQEYVRRVMNDYLGNR